MNSALPKLSRIWIERFQRKAADFIHALVSGDKLDFIRPNISMLMRFVLLHKERNGRNETGTQLVFVEEWNGGMERGRS
jgi:hypothetical protein